MGTGKVLMECKCSEGQMACRFLCGRGEWAGRSQDRQREADKLGRGWILKSLQAMLEPGFDPQGNIQPLRAFKAVAVGWREVGCVSNLEGGTARSPGDGWGGRMR